MEKVDHVIRQLKKAVCQIIVDDNIVASAFLYRQSFLLTAGHIFEGRDYEKNITAKFIGEEPIDAKIIHSVYNKQHGIDYAILELSNTMNNIEPLKISCTKYSKGEIISMGFGVVLESLSSAEGRIIGEYVINKEEYLLKIESKELGQLGFSGAPIYSIRDQAVIAIQCEDTNNEKGAERDTVLAFPFERLKDDINVRSYVGGRDNIKASEYIEKYLLPVFGRTLLRLEHSDNLDAYMRCIVVKLVPEKDERFTVFVAKSSNNTFIPAIRKHHRTRKMRYGVVGGMIKANVPIIYDFVNDKCYQLDIGGIGKESTILTKGKRGAREDRIALLVAPIRDTSGMIVGVLSFDFFSVQSSDKNIINIINKSSTELGRILYLAEFYAQTIAQLLLCNYIVDVDFFDVQPGDV